MGQQYFTFMFSSPLNYLVKYKLKKKEEKKKGLRDCFVECIISLSQQMKRKNCGRLKLYAMLHENLFCI